MSNAIKCFAMILALTQTQVGAAAAQLPTIDEVRDAYRKRVEEIRSLRVELAHAYEDYRTADKRKKDQTERQATLDSIPARALAQSQ